MLADDNGKEMKELHAEAVGMLQAWVNSLSDKAVWIILAVANVSAVVFICTMIMQRAV